MAKILVADDDRVQCDLLAHMIKSSGHEATCAYSGKEAFDLVKSQLPDIAILDLHMEKDDIGIYYGSRIQDELRIPVILISAATGSESVLKAARIHPSAFLTKPCSHDQLNAAVLIAQSHVLFLSCNLKIRELTHRVKNNLVSIYGFIELSDTPQGLHPEAVSELKAQLLSMSMIYDHLSSHGGSIDKAEAASYLDNLIHDIATAFHGHTIARLTTEIDKISLDENVLNSIGMFVNEAMTNCYKYAFKGRDVSQNRIKIKFRKSDGSYKLTVADNGTGMQKALDVKQTRGLGLSILHSIATTLHGSVKIVGNGGVRVTLKIPAGPPSAKLHA